MKSLHIALTALLLLTACATANFNRLGCPTVIEYSAAFQAQLADALEALPTDSPIHVAMSDYKVIRDQARACQRAR